MTYDRLRASGSSVRWPSATTCRAGQKPTV